MTAPEGPRPLARVCGYLATRHRVLTDLADEVLALLDEGEAQRASDRMWLWTLGAYEVARTLSQAHEALSPSFHRAVTLLKVELEQVRVPATKLERVQYDRRTAAQKVTPLGPPEDWDAQTRDLRVGEPGRPDSARRLLTRYREVMVALTHAHLRAPPC